MKEEDILKYDNVPVIVASKYLDVAPQYIRIGLQRKAIPIGSAVQTGTSKKWSYQISPGALIKWKNGEAIENYLQEHLEFFKRLIGDKI